MESLAAEGWETGETPLRAEARVVIPPEGAGRVWLAPTVAGEKHAYASGERVDAVVMPYPWRERDEITISLPGGMQMKAVAPLLEARLKLAGQVISKPENGESTGLRRRTPGEVVAGAYQSVRKMEEHTITIVRTLAVGALEVPLGEYGKWQEFFGQVEAGDRETAVFSAGVK